MKQKSNILKNAHIIPVYVMESIGKVDMGYKILFCNIFVLINSCQKGI